MVSQKGIRKRPKVRELDLNLFDLGIVSVHLGRGALHPQENPGAWEMASS
jgi:hypothetical protein